MARALALAAAVAVLGCSDDAPKPNEQGGRLGGAGAVGGASGNAGPTGVAASGEAGTAKSPTDAGAPGGSGGSAGAAGTAGTAAANAPPVDAGAKRDAAHPPDAADAGHDGGAASTRICAPGATYGSPLPSNATATLVMGGFEFIEGAVWHAPLGVLFFSDMSFGNQGPNGVASRIHRFTPPSTFDVFVASSGSNGIALDLEGKLLACTHDSQSLSTFDPENGTRSTLDLDYMGNHFNSPNDVAVRSDGNVYFTDPDWQLPPRSPEIGFTGVYRLTPAGDVELVDGSLDKPNGIALSPDEQTLYVGSAGNDVMRYPVAADGGVGSGSVFVSPGGSDGFAMDCAGNLYVTAGAIRVFDPSGADLGSISVPESPSNAAFGGPERKTLYITAQTGLYAIDLGVPGYPY